MIPVYDKLAGEPCNIAHYMIDTSIGWDDIIERVYFFMMSNITEEKLLSEPHL